MGVLVVIGAVFALAIGVPAVACSCDAECTSASWELFEAAASKDKTLCEYVGAWHALWAEPVDTRKRLLCDVLDWLCARVPGLASNKPVQ